MSKKQLFITSSHSAAHEQEKDILFHYWGGNRKLKLRPFQIRHNKPDKVGTKDYLGGLSLLTIKRLENIEETCTRHALYFFPNDVETQLYQRRSESGGKVKEWLHRDLVREIGPNNEYKNVQRLANLYFCYIDYDLPKDLQNESDLNKKKECFVSKLNSFEPKPDVIIDSGRGIHAYWGIKPIRLLELRPKEAKATLLRFKEVQKLLQCHFESDPATVSMRGRLMRVPNSWNIKSVERRTWCKYILGDLCEARASPKRTLFQLSKSISAQFPKNPKKRGPKKQPKSLNDGISEALDTFKNIIGLKKLSQPYKRVFTYYWGLSWVGSVIEGKRARDKKMRVNGSQLNEVRQKLIDLGLIIKESEANYTESKGARYVFTEKFDATFGIDRKKRIREERQVIDEVINSPCPSGERIKLLGLRLNKLVFEAGITDTERLHNILVQWINNRPAGLPRDYNQIDYFIQTHYGIRLAKKASE